MIDSGTRLSISRQCALLSVSRSTYYHRPSPQRTDDLAVMKLIDEIHLELPFYGSRCIPDELGRHGYTVNRKRVQRLMRQIGIVASYPKPRTTQRDVAHKIYPYQLRNLEITRPNQVWCADITYIPMARGFVYLVAIMDWYSRKVLSWRLSNTMDTGFCVAALRDALDHYGEPGIFNTDQGSQFTSEAFTEVLSDAGICISMDSRGRWMDNVFIERLWRSLKYEEVYLHAYADVRTAEGRIDWWMDFYNERRRHRSLNRRTPTQAYADQESRMVA